MFLRYSYVKFTEDINLPVLTVLFPVAHAYKVFSLWLILRAKLKSFLPGDPFAVYLIACRHDFLKEAKEAVMISTPQSYTLRDYGEEIRHVSDTDVSRFIRFVQSREDMGRAVIRDAHRSSPSSYIGRCSGCDKDWNDAKGFCTRLGTIFEEKFIHNPCAKFEELLLPALVMLDCSRHVCEWDDGYSCPLQFTYLRNFVEDLVRRLGALNREMLAMFFEEDTEVDRW